MSDTPPPGIYENIPFAEYISWQAISNSRITLARKSMRHYKHTEFKDTSEKKAYKLGSFIHCGILEPLSIIERYAVIPEYENDVANVTQGNERSYSKTTKYVRQKTAEFVNANKGKQFIEKSEYDILLGISKAISADEDAKRYLNGTGKSELSILWNDTETGLLCKARIDYKTSVINDLKTTEDASQGAFERSIANYGYHRQAAHYRNGWEALTGEILPFVIIAVEKSSPFSVMAQPIDAEAIEVGCTEVAEALRNIAEAEQTEQYKSYPKSGKWFLPSWYKLPEVQLISNGESVTV